MAQNAATMPPEPRLDVVAGGKARASSRSREIYEILGKRWTDGLLSDLAAGPRRFRQLLASLGGINDKVLTQRLRELDAFGLIERRTFEEEPSRVEYALTAKGRDLRSAMIGLERWYERWAGVGNRS